MDRDKLDQRFQTDPEGARAQAQTTLTQLRNTRLHMVKYANELITRNVMARAGSNANRTTIGPTELLAANTDPGPDEAMLVQWLEVNG